MSMLDLMEIHKQDVEIADESQGQAGGTNVMSLGNRNKVV